MNCSCENCCEIKVDDAGILRIKNSTITSYNPENPYNFIINGTADISDSNIYFVWGNPASLSTQNYEESLGGIKIYKDSVILDNNEMRYFNSDWLTVVNSSPKITSLTLLSLFISCCSKPRLLTSSILRKFSVV